MEAIYNIKKITKAMKMVASAKLRRCEDQLKVSRAFSKGILDLWGPEENAPSTDDLIRLGPQASKGPSSTSAAGTPTAETEGGKAVVPNSELLVVITPDRGLCGSVSSAANRAARNRMNVLRDHGKTLMLLVYGEKARASLERNYSRYFVASIGDHSKLKRRTFKQTLQLADLMTQQPNETAEVVYNQFKNMISFQTKIIKLPTYNEAVTDSKLFEPYELEGDSEILENLYHFTMAVRLHLWFAESDMVEFSQRVSSMSNSSKSAEDMLARLKLVYNRTRQSKITTELVEIISGSSASDDAKKQEEES